MLPNNSTEAAPQALAGGTEQPTPQPSGAQGEPLPEYVTALQNQVAELTKAFRTTQGSADAQFGQLRGDIKRILELKEQGLNESQIQRELFVDSLMTGKSAPVQQSDPGRSAPNTGLDVEGTLKELQFESNDVAIAALKIAYRDDPSALLREAAKLRLTQLTQKPAGPAGALPPSGGSSPDNGRMTVEETYAKYAELEELTKNYSLNKPKIEALRAELQQRGAAV